MIFEVFIITAIPLLFLLIFLQREQRMLIYFLLWGLTAAIMSYYTYQFLDFSGIWIPQKEVTIAPFIEEFFKALPLIILFIFTGKKFEKFILPLAMASGIGFSILENYLYIMGADYTGLSTIMFAVTRAMTTSVMHGCTTAVIGYGFFLIKDLERQALTPLLIGLYTTAVTIHAIFNILVVYSNTGKVIGVILPIALFIVLVLLFYKDELSSTDASIVD